MVPFFIFLVSFVLLWIAGRMGVAGLSFWRVDLRLSLLATFLFTGVTHFTSMQHDYLAMIPGVVPAKTGVVYLTGVLQIAGAIGLQIRRLRRLSGLCLVLLLGAMFPANIHAALNDIPFRGEAATALWLRTPIQVVFVLGVWFSSVQDQMEQRRPSAH